MPDDQTTPKLASADNWGGVDMSGPQLVQYPGSPLLVPRRPKPGTGVTWHIRELAKILDGDTVHLWRQRWVVRPAAPIADGLWGTTTEMVYDHPTPGQCRVYDLATPEDDEPGGLEATGDITAWFEDHPAEQLRVETWPGGGFGRWLADVFVESDRADTLTKFMHAQGWPGYRG
jgi:endonuclease YncB( thermonuclease family)